MNIFAFLVLVFSVTVIAEDKTSIEYKFKLVMKCLDKAHMTVEEIKFVQENIMRMQDDKIDEKARKIFEKHGYFAACVEEDLGMIEDSKLVVDKIMEGVERDMARKPVNKDFVKKCANALNDDSELTREERALGMSRCLMAGRIRRRVPRQVNARRDPQTEIGHWKIST
ncbi:uncharacterized protein LOC116853100 [Odontomachus brunneus]|uniref:uncharacterized protein LOC116853100 n=1 Tax=Odontomachus brunneus TaxID=486640 RepID=UPI0013F27971|nr:uncharacterized protein LOC116853100 [Odontomachus brunneus]